MNIISVSAIMLLMLLGAVHVYWAFGGRRARDKALPTKDGKRLIDPGTFLTLFVAILLFLFAYVAYRLRYDAGEGNFFVYAGWALSGVFFVRAVGDFNAVGFFKQIRNTKFAVYDTKYYSPLCIFFGLVFVLLSCQASR